MDLRSAARVEGADRILLSVPTAAGEVVATWHEPPTRTSEIGVVLVNFGPVPRAGVGDLAVRCADAVAVDGWVVLRADLPSLGDAPGKLPQREEPFFQALQDGAALDALAAVVDAACEHLAVQKVILGGLCAGAWTAMHAADARKESVAGIILIEPEFRRSPSPLEHVPSATAVGIRRDLRWYATRLLSGSAWLRFASGGGGREDRVRRATPVLRWLVRRLLAGRLPADVHPPLLRLWQRLASRGMPALIITVNGGWREAYLEQILRRRTWTPKGSRFTHRSLSGTNHVFTAGDGCDALIRTLLAWLADEEPEWRVRD